MCVLNTGEMAERLRQSRRKHSACACDHSVQVFISSDVSDVSFKYRRDGRVVEGAPLLRAYRTKSYRGFESLSLRQYKDLKPAQAALRGRFLWGVAPKAPDCGRGIYPQNPSQTPFISKPPDFFGLSTAAWVLRFLQKRLRTLMNGS